MAVTRRPQGGAVQVKEKKKKKGAIEMAEQSANRLYNTGICSRLQLSS